MQLRALRVDFTTIVADNAYPGTDFVVIYSKNNADIAEKSKNICTSQKEVVILPNIFVAGHKNIQCLDAIFAPRVRNHNNRGMI